jgi:hypothetical protein
MKYYAGIGSRETPKEICNKMTEIASLLEKQDFILRSGGAQGADHAFEIGISDPLMMDIYLPYMNFNNKSGSKYIFISNHDHINYKAAYESLKYHPRGFNMSHGTKVMMIRNYFQACGLVNQSNSSFVICWTPKGANGYTIKTRYEDGGSGQCIRIAAAHNIPVYNLKDSRYSHLTAQEIVNVILYNLQNGINQDNIISNQTTSNIF